MKSLAEGDLVRILNEDGIQLGIGVYIRTLIPDDEGIGYDQLKKDADILESDSNAGGLYYAVPNVWHNSVLYRGHCISLNTSIYTLLKVEDSDSH